MQKKLVRIEQYATNLNDFILGYNNEPKIPRSKPIFNSEGKMALSKFVFSEKGDKKKLVKNNKNSLIIVTKQKKLKGAGMIG